jgi:hypothetical protein
MDIEPLLSKTALLVSKLKSFVNIDLLVYTIGMIGTIVVFNVVSSLSVKHKAEVFLEEQETKSIQALQDNSQQADALISHLQAELSKRVRVLKDLEFQLEELRQQKTLLDLTSEQKYALQSLLKKSPTARDIYTSSEFWFGTVLGNILTGILFFFIGIVYELRREARQNKINDKPAS